MEVSISLSLSIYIYMYIYLLLLNSRQGGGHIPSPKEEQEGWRWPSPLPDSRKKETERERERDTHRDCHFHSYFSSLGGGEMTASLQISKRRNKQQRGLATPSLIILPQRHGEMVTSIILTLLQWSGKQNQRG